MLSLIALISGGIFTFAFAPYYKFFVGFLSFPILLILIHFAKTPRKAFLYGFLFAFAHHFTGLYWISNSLMVEADKFAWLVPFASSLIPAYLALYVGFLCYLVKVLKYQNVAKILFFSGSWVLLEIVRGHAFTGFPWNLSGYVFLHDLNFAQTASYVGVYGLSFFAILLYSAPYSIISNLIAAYQQQNVLRASLSTLFLMPICLVYTALSYHGFDRIKENPTKFSFQDIRIVQPNIPQKEKFDPYRIGDHLYRLYSLTVSNPEKADADKNKEETVPEIVVWPEVATPFVLKKAPEILSQISDIIPYNSYLITGSLRQEGQGENQKSFNSLQIINSDGEILPDAYDKFHLVPFGEYIPMRKYLPNIQKLTHGMGDFTAGGGNQTMSLPNPKIPPFSPLICYEIIFPSKAAKKDASAKWIVNVTNDAWFGNSSGPYQHLDAARMRAIEEGLPVIRTANTGISAVISPTGEIIDSLPLNQTGIIDTKLPKALPQTYYAKSGLRVSIILAAFIICLSIIVKNRQRNISNSI